MVVRRRALPGGGKEEGTAMDSIVTTSSDQQPKQLT